MASDEHTKEPPELGSELGRKRVEEDTRKVMIYVKDYLFLRVIDVFDAKKQLVVNGVLYKDYVKNCKQTITGIPVKETLSPQWNNYMVHIWKEMDRTKKYKEWLGTKRSNAYQAVQDKFTGKLQLM